MRFILTALLLISGGLHAGTWSAIVSPSYITPGASTAISISFTCTANETDVQQITVSLGSGITSFTNWTQTCTQQAGTQTFPRLLSFLNVVEDSRGCIDSPLSWYSNLTSGFPPQVDFYGLGPSKMVFSLGDDTYKPVAPSSSGNYDLLKFYYGGTLRATASVQVGSPAPSWRAEVSPQWVLPSSSCFITVTFTCLSSETYTSQCAGGTKLDDWNGIVFPNASGTWGPISAGGNEVFNVFSSDPPCMATFISPIIAETFGLLQPVPTGFWFEYLFGWQYDGTSEPVTSPATPGWYTVATYTYAGITRATASIYVGYGPYVPPATWDRF